MIVDVHSHTPQFRHTVPSSERFTGPQWRPDRHVEAIYSWGDFLAAMEPVDKVIVFPIAWFPGSNAGGVTGTPLGCDMPDPVSPNEATATFVKAYPDKLIGFMSIHPH